ncbi:spermatogenesis-associated protein 46 [Phaenicophaeus curvirostris]|uniref:spermatogenesis-associated protein 46 n=1 Tax=Phaenicophaeus curvirostris TaxID=33595 RepID=UPI0037F09BE9
MAVGNFSGQGSGESHPTCELYCFHPYIFPAEIITTVGVAPRRASSAPSLLPLWQRSSLWDSSNGLLGESCAVPVSQCPLASCANHSVPASHVQRVGVLRAGGMHWHRASHLCIPWRQRGRDPSPTPNPMEDQLPAPTGNELPTHTIYRPWFSPYSYFMSTKEAAQQHMGSLSSSTQKSEEPDDLSETACSFSDSLNEIQPWQRGRLASSSVSITVHDILTASQRQPVPQHGYWCVSRCGLFPTLWLIKTHIQHCFQEGYSCKVYYCRLKALWEKEEKEHEASTPGAPV